MVDSLVSILESVAMRALHSDEPIVPCGNDHAQTAPLSTYAAGDGPVAIGVSNDHLFERLAGALGRDEWLTDPRFMPYATRCAHGEQLRVEIERALAGMSRDEAVEALSAAGVPAAPVSGVREALDAYRDSPGAEGIHHRIEHIETLQPQDLPRFAGEQVIASMQAQHMMWLAPDRSDNWSRRLGDDRCRRAFPLRSLLESGAMVTLGSDWPVARFDPRLGIAAARLRRPPAMRGRAPYDDQAIGALEALEGYTTWPARTVGHAAHQGRVKPGFWGDLSVFAEDPVLCPADDLPDNPVLLTVTDGEITHRASSL